MASAAAQCSPAAAAENLGYRAAFDVIKAGTSAARLSDLPDVQSAANAWLGTLRASAFDRATRYMLRVPRRASTGILGITAGLESEGSAKSIRTLTVTKADLVESKVAAMLVATREFLLAPDFSPAALDAEMGAAVGLATDTAWITELESGATTVTTDGQFRSRSPRAVFCSLARCLLAPSLRRIRRRLGRSQLAAGIPTRRRKTANFWRPGIASIYSVF